MSEEMKPRIVDGIPMCNERCPSFDGKRCELLGFRPDRICEPAVKRMEEAIRQTLGRLDYLTNLWGAEGVTRSLQDKLRESIGE